MRTLIVTAFVSLDGVMEAPGGEPGYRNSGWTFKDIKHVDEAYEIKGREQQEAAAMMMGRVSYDAFSLSGLTSTTSRSTTRCRSTSCRPRSRSPTW